MTQDSYSHVGQEPHDTSEPVPPTISAGLCLNVAVKSGVLWLNAIEIDCGEENRNSQMLRMCPASVGWSKTVSNAVVRCSETKARFIFFALYGIGVREHRSKLTLSAGPRYWPRSYLMDRYNKGVAAARKFWLMRERENKSCWSR